MRALGSVPYVKTVQAAGHEEERQVAKIYYTISNGAGGAFGLSLFSQLGAGFIWEELFVIHDFAIEE